MVQSKLGLALVARLCIYRVLELTAGLVVISVAFTPDLRDWGTLLGPLGTIMTPWLAGQRRGLGFPPTITVSLLYCILFAVQTVASGAVGAVAGGAGLVTKVNRSSGFRVY
jgi:hypothetical protein